jgi:hypothetical protein
MIFSPFADALIAIRRLKNLDPILEKGPMELSTRLGTVKLVKLLL